MLFLIYVKQCVKKYDILNSISHMHFLIYDKQYVEKDNNVS